MHWPAAILKKLLVLAGLQQGIQIDGDLADWQRIPQMPQPDADEWIWAAMVSGPLGLHVAAQRREPASTFVVRIDCDAEPAPDIVLRMYDDTHVQYSVSNRHGFEISTGFLELPRVVTGTTLELFVPKEAFHQFGRCGEQRRPWTRVRLRSLGPGFGAPPGRWASVAAPHIGVQGPGWSTTDPDVVVASPFVERWVVYQGPGGEYSHINSLGIDATIVDGGFSKTRTHTLSSEREDYYVSSLWLQSPVRGVVTRVVDSYADPAPRHMGPQREYNAVHIRTSTGFDVYMGHVAQASATVAPGDVVRRGALVGRAGTAGGTTYPHVHLEARSDTGTASIAFADVSIRLNNWDEDPWAMSVETWSPVGGWFVDADITGALEHNKQDSTD